MEQRKSISLVALLLRYALSCVVSFLFVLGAAWVFMGLLLQNGTLLPASAPERSAYAAKEQLAKKGVFDAALVPTTCDYLLLEASKTVATSLTEKKDAKAFSAAVYYAKTGVNTGEYFHCNVQLGAQNCVLQYRFAMQYTNPTLQKHLPDFQIILIILVPLTLFILFGMLTWHAVNLFKKHLAPLNMAAQQLAQGDLEHDFAPSGIKEYAAVLASMTKLKTALQGSLRAQWSMEQGREAQTAALVHDLKTPLTVIDGNAQLLAESTLDAAQRQSVDAILRGTASVQAYAATLRRLAQAQAMTEQPQTAIDGMAFLQKIETTAREICAVYGVRFVLTAQQLPAVKLAMQEVERAVANLVENAAEHTPKEQTVQMHCVWTAPTLAMIVEDGGTGFTPQALQHATDFLFTENESRTQNGHIGLGLATAKATAKKYGGTVTVKNTEKGHGEVTITLQCKA